MNQWLDQLTNLLRQQIELHERLLHLLESESQSFGSVRGSELLRLQISKERLAQKIERLEQKRLQVVRRIAGDWKVDERELRLRNIIDRVDSQTANTLRNCHQRLTELLTGVRELAERNANEASARLRSVETALRFISELQGGQQTYSGVGAIQHLGNKITRTAA